MILIGLTGGIGSGKSTVAGFMRRMGAKIIDADKVGKDVLKKNEVKEKLKKKFGCSIFKGRGIDRVQLAATAFVDKKSVKELISVTHPEILREIEKRIKELGSSKVIVIDAPLLIESGFYRGMDKVLVVSISKKKQIERAVKNGFLKNDVVRRLNNQMTTKEKLTYADMVINNNGTKKNTRKKAEIIMKKIIKMNENMNEKRS